MSDGQIDTRTNQLPLPHYGLLVFSERYQGPATKPILWGCKETETGPKEGGSEMLEPAIITQTSFCGRDITSEILLNVDAIVWGCLPPNRKRNT